MIETCPACEGANSSGTCAYCGGRGRLETVRIPSPAGPLDTMDLGWAGVGIEREIAAGIREECDRLRADRTALADEVHALADLLMGATGRDVIISDLAAQHATCGADGPGEGS